MIRVRPALTALVAATALALTACAGDTDAAAPAATGDAKTATVEDNTGSKTVTLPLTSVVATDNRTFETLESWGVELTAAARTLMPTTIGYKTNDKIVDLGSHAEPDLEAIVAVEPQLVVNGQRFTQHEAAIAKLAPDATILNLDPRDGQPLDAELKRQVTVLGEVFGKQTEAKKLADDLDAAVARVKAAYDPAQKVMAVTTSGGEIGYIAPEVGRTLGPLFGLLGLTPALEVEGASDDHQGDDISVEAIADANPDWILVMDRDAAVAADDPAYTPAANVLASAEPLSKVSAVTKKQLVFMPTDTYTNEGIQTYTEFLNTLADALEAAA
ncbi:ABC transporter substrate-binding protein [Flavimobilis sp. GY10621]|uniref:ABC transporter substrate-binding protein n=1 Tax=Flavimobilis rhizosphaerae TaxID=2775421 RepID=A0ABR9DTW0_9MICO|nr:ABC transporter substrate-binding protein [Flavimobilis rhizosphaerae]MBD9699445.1 ABC transporter substrate-binding protein [Flavimobilis rhizosphaerae]